MVPTNAATDASSTHSLSVLGPRQGMAPPVSGGAGMPIIARLLGSRLSG